MMWDVYLAEHRVSSSVISERLRLLWINWAKQSAGRVHATDDGHGVDDMSTMWCVIEYIVEYSGIV